MTEDLLVQTVRALTLAVETRVTPDGQAKARVVLDESMGDTYPLTGDYPSDGEAVAALAEALKGLISGPEPT